MRLAVQPVGWSQLFRNAAGPRTVDGCFYSLARPVLKGFRYPIFAIKNKVTKEKQMSTSGKDQRELSQQQLEKIAGGMRTNNSSSSTGETPPHRSSSSSSAPRKHPQHPPVIHHTSSST
jgi:hypothetical protein